MSDQQDKSFETFSEAVKKMPIPTSLRTSNRAAIARFLKQDGDINKTASPWWQRRISIPLSWAAVLLMVMGLQAVIIMQFASRSDRPSESGDSVTTRVPIETEPVESHWEQQHQQQSIYVAGFGTIYKSEMNTNREI
ncbi:hypothetical protein ACFL6U_11845 [Planctomycetota bacterium]